MNRVKTWVLIAALGGLFVLLGGLIFHGTGGYVVGLVFGLGFNLAMYWFSDKVAIATSRSKPVTEQEYPALYRIVHSSSNFVRNGPKISPRFGKAANPNDLRYPETAETLSII